MTGSFVVARPADPVQPADVKFLEPAPKPQPLSLLRRFFLCGACCTSRRGDAGATVRICDASGSPDAAMDVPFISPPNRSSSPCPCPTPQQQQEQQQQEEQEPWSPARVSVTLSDADWHDAMSSFSDSDDEEGPDTQQQDQYSRPQQQQQQQESKGLVDADHAVYVQAAAGAANSQHNHQQGRQQLDHHQKQQQQQQQQQEPVWRPPLVPVPAPDMPLMFADFPTPPTWVAIPAVTPFGGFWARDYGRTTSPKPINVLMRDNWVVRKVQESIVGIELRDFPDRIEVHVRPPILPPGMPSYQETFWKNGATGHWKLRRDVRPGRSHGRAFLTSDGVLVLKVWSQHLLSSVVDQEFEEYLWLERSEDGSLVTLVARQHGHHTASGGTAQQWLVGSQPVGAVRGL